MEKAITSAKRAYGAVRHHGKRATRFEKVRFALVGVANTAVDFFVLIILVTVFHTPAFIANIASTTAALVTSFGLNKKTVFKGEDGKHVKQLVLFLIVTIASIWLVQTVVMTQLYNFARDYFDVYSGWQALALLIGAKVIGIIAGSIWNYMWYSRVVFKNKGA